MCVGGSYDIDPPDIQRPVIPVTPKEKPKTLSNPRASGEEDGKLRRKGVQGLLIPMNRGGIGTNSQ